VSEHETTGGTAGEPSRRDFLYLTTGMAGVVGAAAVAWPFIDQMRPDASTLALASIEVDEAKSVPMAELKDPVARNANVPADAEATDLDRSAGEGKENWIVMIGSCTHLGCVPLGQAGDFGGWFCPCHGSHYDTAGRIRKGPAPENLHVPTYSFVSDTVIRIG